MLLPFIKEISRNHFELWVEDLKPQQKVDSTKGLLKSDQIYYKDILQIYKNRMTFHQILRDISGIF